MTGQDFAVTGVVGLQRSTKPELCEAEVCRTCGRPPSDFGLVTFRPALHLVDVMDVLCRVGAKNVIKLSMIERVRGDATLCCSKPFGSTSVC